MGGNAIKNVSITRYNREQYDALCAKVRHVFETDRRVIGTRIHITDCFEEKQDFGDLDVLIQEPHESYERPWNLEIFRNLFATKEIHRNGSVVSMEHEGFQIDFIEVPRDEFDFAKAYFAWNDLGNLMGKTARQLGLKYGHQGLVYTIRDGIGDKVGEIVVTKDPKEAFQFLGYDWDRFQLGFKNLEEIFRFAVSSKYFNPKAYALENLNHVDRIRDKKRATYQAFLTWLKESYWGEYVGFTQNPEGNLKRIRRAFPEFAMMYDLAHAKLAKKAAMKVKFNGTIVSELTKLKTFELGTFMKLFREWFRTEDDLIDYVIYTSPTALSEAVRSFHQKLLKAKVLNVSVD